MLTEDDIIGINKILRSVGNTALTELDIEYLNGIGTDVTEPCDLYIISQQVLVGRLSKMDCDNLQQEKLVDIANVQGCSLELITVKSKIKSPIWGVGVS